jgi:pimeloyl-ACP methyl ester carboxylesterase
VPKVLANGIQIHYQQAGEGRDVVLVHGVTGDLSIWYVGVMPYLAKEFKVTAYDLRGHGYSEGTPSGYTSTDMAADLDGLLGSLGIERAHLVGHSFGAAVALHTAVLYPKRVASLVLADPGLPVLQPLVDLNKWAYFESFKKGFQDNGIVIPDDKWADLVYVTKQALAARRPALPFGLRRHADRSYRRLLRLMENTSALTEAQEVAGLTLDRIAEVRQPTLVIYGEMSQFVQTAPYLQERMPHSQVAILDRVAHFFALSKPELLVGAVMKFLRELNGGDASRLIGGASRSAPERDGHQGG